MSEPLKVSASFEKVYMEYQHRLQRLAYKYVGDRAVAEDMVSSSFASYWENRDKYTSDNLPALITSIVKNNCLNWLRSQQLRASIQGNIYSEMVRENQKRLATLESSNPDKIFEDEIISIVHQTLEELPELTREIFTGFRLEDKSYKEIEAEKSVSPQKIQYELRKAMKALRLALHDFLMLF